MTTFFNKFLVENRTEKDTCTPIFIATLFMIRRTCKQPERSPLASEEIKKLQYIFTMEYCCSVAQSLSHVQLLTTSWTATHQASLSITISQNLLKFMSIESVMPSSHLILCHPLLCLLSIFLSIRVFSNKSDLCIRKPKYWIFSFSISPSNEYTGLISYRID